MSLEIRVARNKRFLTDLFAGPFRGHAIIMDPEPTAPGWPGDFTCSERPVRDWVPWALRDYEAQCERLEALDDDNVPSVEVHTGTQIFAAAFGCPVHIFEGSNAGARPLVTTAEEADRLPEPALDTPPLDRVWEFAEEVQRRAGRGVPIRVPDVQSPFDIAALIWNKEDLFQALYDNPGAVQRLVGKCHRLLDAFLREFERRIPGCSFCHYPRAWAPPELGCWLSEDEAGSLSTAMFEEFCLPSLLDLSRAFGGLFMHCCATADHQYASFRKIPNLRGLNRVFQTPGPRPAIEAFSGATVLMITGTDEPGIHELLQMARPDTRFLFNLAAQRPEEARRTYERLRALCPRS